MKLIDKDTLVAEIENLVSTYKKCPTRNSYEEGLKDGRLIGYKDALHKINTLEVKEVDLEKSMSKAEKFIKDYTRNCYNYDSYAQDPIPWLTPDQARRAVEIAREETIDEVIEWIDKNVAKYLVDTSIHGVKVTGIHISLTEDLRKELEE